MDLGRFPIRFFGGPYAGRSATAKLLYDHIVFCDGFALETQVYVKMDELEYAYASEESVVFDKDEAGRDWFLKVALFQPDHGVEFDDKNFS
jgi:hypothetical protein